MKAIIIYINFIMSFVALSVGIIGAVWFCIACAILIRADKKGTMDKLKEKLRMNDL